MKNKLEINNKLELNFKERSDLTEFISIIDFQLKYYYTFNIKIIEPSMMEKTIYYDYNYKNYNSFINELNNSLNNYNNNKLIINNYILTITSLNKINSNVNDLKIIYLSNNYKNKNYKNNIKLLKTKKIKLLKKTKIKLLKKKLNNINLKLNNVNLKLKKLNNVNLKLKKLNQKLIINLNNDNNNNKTEIYSIKKLKFNFYTIKDMLLYIKNINVDNFIKIHTALELDDNNIKFYKSLNVGFYTKVNDFEKDFYFKYNQYLSEYSSANINIKSIIIYIYIISDDNAYIKTKFNNLNYIYTTNNNLNVETNIKKKIKLNINKLNTWVNKNII